MYLIDANNKGQRNEFSFAHFFHMQAIHQEHAGLDIISMEDFIKREALTARFRDPLGTPLLPPGGGNRTNFDGEADLLYPYLYHIGHVPEWEPESCLAAFPASTSTDDMNDLLEMDATLQSAEDLPGYVRDELFENVFRRTPQASLLLGPFIRWETYIGKPIPVDSSSLERLKEMRAGRRRLCIYNQTMQDATLVHLAAMSDEPERRLLGKQRANANHLSTWKSVDS
jgi:hypothetical protein